MASPKIFLLAPTVMCIILGLILLFIALATPAWQVVYARELQQWLQSGLWMSCQTRPSGMHMCSYAFAESDLNMHANVDILNIRPPTFYSHYFPHIAELKPMLESLSKLEKCQLGSSILAIVSNILLVIGTLTPAWQVAEDTDVSRYVQSGLWLYCPGAAQCWYIFSDNLINYYEKVDVCRFLLIGDCRKKLLRTPYFFGWHYAVLILNIVSIGLISLATVAVLLSYFKSEQRRIATIAYDGLVFIAVLCLGISLMVFVINAEMLESKYLIGVKNTFEKHYGYSFYLVCLALLLLVFASLGAVLMTTFTFFTSDVSSNLQRSGPLNTKEYHNQIYHINTPHNSKPDVYIQDSISFLDPGLSRSATSVLQSTPQISLQHGDYITPTRSPNGEFQPTTRYFYSY
ncbi:hypothetical protein Angca_009753 [Angiostrongylus cantonensis]|nr:hypothetical protein Angca_009753 [Angiostrongylus cantonensis]